MSSLVETGVVKDEHENVKVNRNEQTQEKSSLEDSAHANLKDKRTKGFTHKRFLFILVRFCVDTCSMTAYFCNPLF